jgi:hypothetical protein
MLGFRVSGSYPRITSLFKTLTLEHLINMGCRGSRVKGLGFEDQGVGFRA